MFGMLVMFIRNLIDTCVKLGYMLLGVTLTIAIITNSNKIIGGLFLALILVITISETIDDIEVASILDDVFIDDEDDEL